MEYKFEKWLLQYGEYWERRYHNKFAELFAESALFYWTPFRKALKGRDEISAEVKKFLTNQRNIKYEFEILYENENKVISKWWCSLFKVDPGIDVSIAGILEAVFDENGECVELRQWWHSDENP